MFNKIKKYINDNEFRMTIFNSKIYVVNYIEIITLDDDRITLLTPNGKLIVKGRNLLLNKLVDKEILINGKVYTIEVDTNE